MPPLQDTIRKDNPAGYVPATVAPVLPPPPALPNSFKVNPWLRSPLPPTSAGPDTLRQFNDGDTNIPRRRVLPLPVNNGVGGGTVTNNTTVIQGSSSGASSAALTAQTVSYVSPLLNAGSTGFGTLNLTAKSFQLITMTATGPCEVRMYGTSLAMAIDAGRAIDAPPAAEYANNIITDVVLDTAPFSWNWQNRVGANSNSPQTTNLYIAVTNLSGGPTAVQVNITMLPLESA